MMKMSRGVPIGLSILSLFMLALFLVFFTFQRFRNDGLELDWPVFSYVVPLITLKVILFDDAWLEHLQGY